jgi:hypothetical protein
VRHKLLTASDHLPFYTLIKEKKFGIYLIKIKTNKIISYKSIMNIKGDDTIDNLYTKKLKHFHNTVDIIIPKLNVKIEELENKRNPENKDEINQQIINLKNKIRLLKEEKNKYYLENSKYLFEYFESKQDIDKNINPKKKISNFFKLKDDVVKTENINHCINEYMEKNNFEIVNLNNYSYNKSICENCNIGELIKVNHEGIIVCNHCFTNHKYLVDNDKPTYKEPPKEVSFYAYKRINHFREILSQFQAKESTDIPKEIIEQISSQVKKERIQLSQLTNKKMKEILKKLKYNKYYEHIPFIKDKLGIKPPVMSPKLEDTLCNLFMDIQIPYAKYCPNSRVNFLNYYYTLYKLCELLGENQYLEFYPMLKDQKKVEQDEIWKKICNDLNWDYIPTI